jgi:hypothetical protein
VFQLGERAMGNSVRVYGRLREEVALLTATAREGRPTLFPLAAGAGGAVQFLVAWDESPSTTGARPVRLDVMRQHADGVRVVWSTAEVYPDTLMVREYAVRGPELRVRYQLRYPGWVAGCDGQTEQEDVFRLTPATGTYTRTGQRSFDGWHRELRAAASQLFTAVATSDRRALTALVPDARVRERLPRKLESEPVCDAATGSRSEQVAVAATDGDGAPWTLLFHRDGGRWRVSAASRVIP